MTTPARRRSGFLPASLVAFAFLLPWSLAALSVTNVYQNGVGGYTGAKAVSISTQDTTDTGGNGITAFDDPFTDGELPLWLRDFEERPLLRFDDLNLPPAAAISSAALELTFEDFAGDFELRGFYLLASWDPASAGSNRGIGWLFRADGAPWTVPGAGGLGSDVLAAPTFGLTGFSDSGFQTRTIELDPGVVQSWANRAGANQGVLLVNATTNVTARLFSPWHATTNSRPKLTLVYTPGIPPTIAQGAVAAPNPVVGIGDALTVLGADTRGESNLIYTWSAASKPAGAADPAFSPNGLNAAKSTAAVYAAAGDYLIEAVVQNPAGLTATSSVPVTVQAVFTSIGVAPSQSRILTNGVQTFTATALDQFGHPLVSQPVVAWSAASGGSIDASGKFTASGVPGGPFEVTASAAGLTAAASVTVVLPNRPPLVALTSPTDGQSFTDPTLISVTAGASDPDGSVAKVAFFANGAKLGEVLAPPYTLVWTNPPAGDYAVTASAQDDEGALTDSAPAHITVAASPHPRNWLDAPTLARLRAAAAANSPAWLALKAQCDLYLTGVVDWPDEDAYPNGGSIGEGYQGDGYLLPLMNLGLAFQTLRTLDPARAVLYGQKGADILVKMSEPSNSVHSVNPLRDDGYGIRNYGVGMAMGFDWLHDALTPGQRARVYTALNRWIDAFEADGFGRLHPLGNYFAGYYAAKALAALATEDDNPRAAAQWDDWLNRVHFGMVQPYYSIWMEGGGWPEGWEYGPVASLNMSYPILAARTAKGMDLLQGAAPYRYPLEEGPALTYLAWPSLQTLDQRGTLHSGFNHNASELTTDLVTAQAGLMSLFNADGAARFHRFARDARSLGAEPAAPWREFLFWDDAAPEEDYGLLPRSYWAAGTGMAAVRSSWATNAVWASFSSGAYVDNPDASEQSFDQGALAVVKGGSPFVVIPTGYLMNDPTNGNTFESLILDNSFNTASTNRYRSIENIFYAVSEGTNLIAQAIDAVLDTAGKPNPATPKTRVSRFEDAGDFVAMQGLRLEDAYFADPIDSSPVVKAWTRDVLYLRPKVFVAFDRTTVNRTNLDQFQAFHVAPTPTPAGVPGRFDVVQDGRFLGAVTAVAPAGRSAVVSDVFGLGAAYRLEIHTSDGAASQRWLTVIDAADSADAVATITRLSADEGNILSGRFEGAALKDGGVRWAVLFNAGDADPAGPGDVVYVVSSGERLHVVSGVAPDTGFAITTTPSGAGFQVRVAPGGGFISSPGGELYFRTLEDGTPTPARAEVPPRLMVGPQYNAGRFNFVVKGAAGHRYAIEASSDLNAWTEVASGVAQDGVWFFSAPEFAAPGAGFFRARPAP